MSYHLLFIALITLCVLYISNTIVAVVIAIILFAYYCYRFKKYRVLCFTLLCYSISTNVVNVAPEIPQDKILKVTQIKSAYIVAQSETQDVILYDVENINFDDVIQVNGDYERIEGIHNEGEFYFPEWANRKGIYYSMNVSSYSILEEGSTLRNKVYDAIQHKPTEINGWLKMMLFQIQEDEEISFMALSSGMHLQFIVKALTSIGSMFLSTTTVSMVMLFLIGFIGLSTVLNTSVKRIICSKLIYLFFHKLSNKDRLGLEIILMMLFFPAIRYELAFILPIAYRILYIFNVHKIKRMVITFMLMIPIQFYFYQSIDVIQILLFPFLRIFYGICYGAAWIIFCLPIFSFACIFFKQLQVAIFEITNKFPVFYYYPTMLWLVTWVLYMFQYWNTKSKKIIYKCIALVLYTQASSYLNPFFRIMTIDVGQGDCTLFILPFHQGAMLLDVAGNMYKSIPEDIIFPILHKRGIYDLDKVILTHDDFDHSGGLSDLQKYMKIDEVITQKQERIDVGDLPISVPLFDTIYDTSNDNSIILFLDIYDFKLMFMGDAGHEAEKEILKQYPNLKIDILKIGHHGSKHSSLPSFIHQLDPILALISCGRNNRYGHPDDSVMETLKSEEVYPLNTAVNGSSTLYFSKFISFYKTADGEFGIIKPR